TRCTIAGRRAAHSRASPGRNELLPFRRTIVVASEGSRNPVGLPDFKTSGRIEISWRVADFPSGSPSLVRRRRLVSGGVLWVKGTAGGTERSDWAILCGPDRLSRGTAPPMTEPTKEPGPPTYFGNAATVQVNSDEVSIEFRRVMPTHAEMATATKYGTQPMPQISLEQFWATPPVVKVFLTFSAAKALRDNLVSLLEQYEKLRKEGG